MKEEDCKSECLHPLEAGTNVSVSQQGNQNLSLPIAGTAVNPVSRKRPSPGLPHPLSAGWGDSGRESKVRAECWWAELQENVLWF